MIVLATSTPTVLVVEDYARIEALTEERFDRDRGAAALGVMAELRFAAAPARVEVVLTANGTAPRPRLLRLALRHATNAAGDHELELQLAGDVYVAPADLPPGRFHVELMPEDRAWRLGGVASRLDLPLRLVPQAADPG
jgi:hypothetical protein